MGRTELDRPAASEDDRTRAVIPCSRCPLRRLPAFRPFEPAELAFVQSFKTGELHLEPGDTILRDGEAAPALYTILSGWAIRYKIMREGRRQVLNFALAGDLLGIQASLFKEMDHSVAALTAVRLCVFPRNRILELYRDHPGLGFDLTWIAAREESILASHLANVGQRPASGRLAYVALYLFGRARRAGLVTGNRLQVTITQQDLADAMGLSMVHTNKTLMRLRARGWLSWTRQELTIHDETNLRALAEYDDSEPPARPFL